MESQIQRQRRIGVDIPVLLTTVLDSLEASLVDLTEHGAQISGAGLAPGTRFQIEYLGQTVYAQCRWSEIDRMGVKFSFPLTDGPLFERLAMARASQFPDDARSAPLVAYATRETGPGARSFGRAPVHMGFGRRVG